MTHSDCASVRQRLDDLLDGYLPPQEAAAAETHIADCGACASRRDAIVALRHALREMPVPEPRPGFADAALAAAIRPVRPQHQAPARATRPWFVGWRRLELWMGAAVGAAAAAALMLVLWGVPQRGPLPEDPASVHVTLYEIREIGVAIDTQTAMPGATLTVLVEGGIDLVGFGERREVQWQTDLDAGTNMLSLPIIAHSLEDGRLTALVAHDDRSRRIDVKVRVDSPR